jgi:hypothetical protein
MPGLEEIVCIDVKTTILFFTFGLIRKLQTMMRAYAYIKDR